MTNDTLNPEVLRFDPPGPGSWMLDSTHHGRRPLTRFLWPSYRQAFETGLSNMMERYGLPLAGGRIGDVHGLVYIRIMAIGEPEKGGGGTPPTFVLKAVSRLHPELRRRNKTAARVLEERAWRRDVDHWFGGKREQVVTENRKLQGVALGGLDDDELADHLEQVLRHFETEATEGFANHGGDLVPVGLYLAACEGWGIDQGPASDLLRGASPATMETDRQLAPVAAAIAEAPGLPASVDDVRALGDDVSSIVDAWLDDQGWRLLSSDDIDATTMAESPELQLRALLAARSDRGSVETPDPSALRNRIPADERPRFDELLAEARYGLRQRDDAVGVQWNWPAGLARRALLEVGRRLLERGQAERADHAIELAQDEVRAALAGRGPGGDDLAGRRAFRDLVERSDPPPALGPAEEPPPLHAFPKPLATMAGAVLAIISAMEGDAPSQTSTGQGSHAATLHGVGVGTETYRGRACVVRSPVDALDEVQPGDVLVAPFTSPSYDSLFPLVGALVTDLGGPMSHTAIMAREFGVSAVVGTKDATARITHGVEVEVDPVAGTVRAL